MKNQDVVVELRRHDVSATLRPRQEFLTRLAAKVVREGALEKPGIAVLPNTREILGTKMRVGIFQRNLIRALTSFAKRKSPRALSRQDYLRLPHDEAARLYQKARPRIRELEIDGITSTKEFHMDVLQHLYVSVCYGPNRNVEGGTPLFVDLLRLVDARRSLCLGDLIELEPVAEENFVEELFHPKAQVATLKPSVCSRLQAKDIMRIDGLRYSQLPIIVFSNYLRDGIVHGATRVRRKNRNKPASRPLSYVAIGYG